jgi:hypothetical protein
VLFQPIAQSLFAIATLQGIDFLLEGGEGQHAFLEIGEAASLLGGKRRSSRRFAFRKAVTASRRL